MKAQIIMAIILALGLVSLSGCMLTQGLSDPNQKSKVLVNYALASNGATVSASNSICYGSEDATEFTDYSQHNHCVHTAINGITSSSEWSKGEGWECEFERKQLKPGWYRREEPKRPLEHGSAVIEVIFPAEKRINKVVVYTLDSEEYPVSKYGIRAASLQVMGPMDWVTVGRIEKSFAIPTSASAQRRNQPAGRKITFIIRPVTTNQIRLVVYQSNDVKRPTGSISTLTEQSVARIVEIEATGLEWIQSEQKSESRSEEETELDMLLNE